MLAWSRPALAGPEINIPRAEDGPGVKVGQRSTFHPGFALVTGVDTNVFSTARNEVRAGEVGPADASFIMPVGWLGVGNRQYRDGLLMSPPERTARNLDYHIGAILGFRQYLARNRNVLGQSRFSGGLVMRLAFLPGRKFSINFDEDVHRYAQPGTYEISPQFNFNRVDHKGQLTFIGRPGGGRFSILAGLRNQVLWFEGSSLGGSAGIVLSRGNRTVNGLSTELKWRFLHKSALVLNYGMDWTYYLSCCAGIGDARNEDNFAHRITGGFRGQVLKKVMLDAVGGWGLAYYRDDVSNPATAAGVDTNFSSFIGDLALSYYPSPRAMVGLGLYRSFRDSLLGNYYVDVGARAQVRYEFKWRMLASASAWVAGRQYRALMEPGVEDDCEEFAGGGSDPPPCVVGYAGRDADRFRRRDTVFNLVTKIEQPLGRIFSVALQYDVAVDSATFQSIYRVRNPATLEDTEVIDVAGFNRHVIMLLGAVRL